MKVHQKADPMPTETKIRQELCVVNGVEPLDCLDLDHKASVDHKVHSIAAIQRNFLVYDRQCYLPGEFDIMRSQLVAQAFLIR